MLEKFHGVGAAGLQIKNILQPLVGAQCGLVDGVFAGFVNPVAGHAAFGHGIHFAGAYLHLDRQAVGADQSGVQALVAVAFGDGDIVFDAAGLGLVEVVQRTQCGVAGGHVVDNHAKAVDVHHFGKAQVFGLHFLVDAVEVFFAPFDFGFDIGAHQPLAEGAQHFADHVAAVAAAGFHGFLQGFVAARVQVLERQILQFLISVVQTNAVGDLSVDFQRFLGDAAALFRTHRA